MPKFWLGNTKGSTLTPEQVMDIRLRYAQGNISQGALAREYRVTINTIGRIVRGESWNRLPAVAQPLDVEASLRKLNAKLGLPNPEPPASAAEQRTEGAVRSLDELLKREALKDEGGQGLERLNTEADKAQAADRAAEELLKDLDKT